MKKIFCVVSVLCLMAGAVVANAASFTDDFSDANATATNWSIYTGWNTADDWTVVDGKYTCTDAGSAEGRGYSTVSGFTLSDNFTLSCDIYDINQGANEVGLILRGAPVVGGNCMEYVYFSLNPWAGGDGRMTFLAFMNGPAVYSLGSEVSMGLTGANYYVAGSDRIHVSITATGNAYTAVVDTYNSAGTLKGSNTVSATDTQYMGSTGGLVGFHAYCGSADFDNFSVTTPEPSSMMALLSGLGVAVAAFRRRRA